MQPISSSARLLLALAFSCIVGCFVIQRNFQLSAIYSTVPSLSRLPSASHHQIYMNGPSHGNDYAIRCATLVDVSSIVSCTNDAYVADAFFKKRDYHDRFTEEDVRGMIAAPDSVFIVAECVNTLAVCGSLYLQWSTEIPDNISKKIRTVGKFSAVAVRQSHQKKGVGRLLVLATERLIIKIANDSIDSKKATALSTSNDDPLGAAAVLTMGVINLREELFPWYQSQGYLIGEKMPWDAELARILKEGYEHVHLINMQKTLL